MKTKEFIKKVQELGFYTIDYESKISIVNDVVKVAIIDKLIPMQISNYYYAYDQLCNEDKDKLFDLIVEYAKTPIEEREEEKKYYLRHRWMEGYYTNYLYKRGDYMSLCTLDLNPEFKTQFTLKEIEEIKEKFDTDLSDFEMVEVEE